MGTAVPNCLYIQMNSSDSASEVGQLRPPLHPGDLHTEQWGGKSGVIVPSLSAYSYFSVHPVPPSSCIFDTHLPDLGVSFHLLCTSTCLHSSPCYICCVPTCGNWWWEIYWQWSLLFVQYVCLVLLGTYTSCKSPQNSSQLLPLHATKIETCCVATFPLSWLTSNMLTLDVWCTFLHISLLLILHPEDSQ